MIQREIKKAFRRSRRYLNETFETYWCGYRGSRRSLSADNDMSERNITFHLCRAMAESGFRIYAEVSHRTREGRVGRIDYVAIHPKRHELVAIEANQIQRSTSWWEKEILQNLVQFATMTDSAQIPSLAWGILNCLFLESTRSVHFVESQFNNLT